MLSRFCVALLMLAPIFAAAAPGYAEEPVSFRGQIAPLLLSKCLACHGPKAAEGGYRVDSFQRAIAAGDSGSAGFAAGKPDESEVLRRLLADAKDERMPKDAEPLPPATIALVRRWIAEGAKYDAADPQAPLASIVPPPTHPDPPEKYPQALGVSALAFSADGQELFVGGYHELTVWGVEDGALRRRIKNLGQRIYRIAPNAEGTRLAVACGSPGRHGEVRVVEAATGKIESILGGTSDVLYDAAFDPAGKRIAAGGADSLLRVFDAATGDTLLSIASHSDWILALAWSRDGNRIASASRDKTAKVFDVAAGTSLVTYSGHGQPVRGIAFSPDGQEVFSSGGDFRIHRWKVADGKKTSDVAKFDDDVFKLAAEGEFLFAPSADKSARQFQLSDGKLVRTYGDHSAWLMAVAFHPGTQRVATGAFNGEIAIWNAADGQLVKKFLAVPGR